MIKKFICVVLTVFLVLTAQVAAFARDVLLEGELSIYSEAKFNNEPMGINALRIEDNSNLSLDFYFMNSEETPRNVRALLVVYNGVSKLKKIKTAEGTAYKNIELNLTLSYDFSIEKEDINGKLFVWDTFNNIIPLTAEINFHKNTIYFYDTNNRLLLAQKANGEQMRFTYDNNGNLLSKQYEY